VTPGFDKTERFLGAILADLTGVLSSAERAEVVQFIDVGEYGVALETLAALLVDENKPITPRIFERIVALADSMALREAIRADALRSQVSPGKEEA
jgi:hypothetical protein